MTDFEALMIIWFGAILTLAFVVALHPLLHWIGRLCGAWLADRAERRRIALRRDNITRLPALTNSRRKRP
ncbi:MAG: hypothetical protein KGK07_16270 [Chloroflexota bacterium]|nr:hypothetical protein [Chloroflexota bacterium]